MSGSYADKATQTGGQDISLLGAQPRINLLGVGITPVNLERAIEILRRWHISKRQEYVCCVSVHGLVESQRDRSFSEILTRAAMTTQDGMPLVWWCRYLGFKDTGRACGRDLMQAMCAFGVERGHRHYFYGGAPGVTELLVSNLRRQFPGLIVAGHRSPPFRSLTSREDEAEVAMINATNPDFVWIGLGTPKQDKWMADHLGKIHATAMIGVGAAFDFVAGVTKIAPFWMQRNGLEWAFRLATEPRRLAGRYLIGNSVFLALVARQFLRSGKTPYRDA